MLKTIAATSLWMTLSAVALAEVRVEGPNPVAYEEYSLFAEKELDGQTVTGMTVEVTAPSYEGCYRRYDLKIVQMGESLYSAQLDYLPIPRRACFPDEVRTFETKASIVVPAGDFGTYARFLLKTDHNLEISAAENLLQPAPVELPEMIIQQVNITPVNAGFNPFYKAYKVTAEVELGTNSCFAAGKDAKLEVVRTASEIHVVALAVNDSAIDEGRICPFVYAPVYKTLEAFVRFGPGYVAGVFIDNFQSMGNDVNVEDLR